MTDTKKTHLYGEHVRFGAKMFEFAGWVMPLQYESITSEVKAVRECVGVFDVSHMGEILIEGPDTIEFVDRLITNDFSSIKIDQALYTVMCNEKGGIVDDLLAYKFSKDRAMLVVNAANTEKDYNWI
ncbi:MAG: glycine cleavage system aminomethyltransferase GcvT, partial [Thermotoga sp.]